MKQFPLVDVLDSWKHSNLKRSSQLFLISLVAFYHERERGRGKTIDSNITQEKAVYKVTLSEKEISTKFKFSIDTIINIRRDLEDKIDLVNNMVGFKAYKKKYELEHFSKPWIWKYQNCTIEYHFELSAQGKKIIYIPTKIVYDNNLLYSEKMALIWNLCLRERHGRRPKIKEIEKESGITQRTIRKAKDKYPQFFAV